MNSDLADDILFEISICKKESLRRLINYLLINPIRCALNTNFIILDIIFQILARC